MLLGVIGCVSLFSLLLSLWSYLHSSENVKKRDLGKLLEKSAEELSANYARSLRLIETEWADMYAKFQRLVGRVDRQRALDPAPPPPAPEPVQLSRSDLLRRYKNR